MDHPERSTPAPAARPPADSAPATGGDHLAAQLAGQLQFHWRHQLSPRLQGLTDREYLWEPAPGCWNLRPRGTAGPDYPGAVQAGSGDWVIDFAMPEPDPAPVTTIAWRLGHLLVGVFGARLGSHFGGPETDYFGYDYPGTAAQAVERLDESVQNWCRAVAGLDQTALMAPVGPAEGEWAEHPMVELVLHINREAVHHLAETALLRDLYRRSEADD